MKLAEEALFQYHLKAFFAHYKINQSFKTMFTMTRFRHIEVLFHKFYYYWGKGNCSLEARYTEVPLPGYIFKIFIQLFRERLSEKVHATIPKGIVGSFELTFLLRNLKEWHERPWMYVCES